MFVDVAAAGDWTVEGPTGKWSRRAGPFRPLLDGLLRLPFRTTNTIIHSPELLPSTWVKRINESDADIVHLHWVQGSMLSIADIGRIEKPIVWTLHDMWPFCGAEHYTEEYRWREGYLPHNRPEYESGFDLNRWVWDRKRRHWQRPIHIVAPSQWLKNCVEKSALMHDWGVDLISYPIDTIAWRPLEKKLAREIVGLPPHAPLLLYGGTWEAKSRRKGFDLLLQSLSCLYQQGRDLELVIFGQMAPREPLNIGFPVHYTGPLRDDISLRVLYSAADVLALPSRQDNLPLTCMESLSCGTPVVAFDNSGLPSMINHRITGYLAKAFDPTDFAEGIRWILEHPERAVLEREARNYAIDHFNPTLIANQYINLYEKTQPSGL